MAKIGKTAFVVLVLAGLFFTSACGSDDPTGKSAIHATGKTSGTLSGSGSSAQKAGMDVWRSAFMQENPAATVQYAPDGSGAGRNALVVGEVQFAGTDEALKDKELEESKKQCGENGAFDIPVFISPISVSFNLEGISTLNLDAPIIAKIFRGEIKQWNDSAISSQNPDVSLPDMAITPIHRNDKSGTTQNFTDYLSENAKEQWPDKPSQTWPKSLDGESAKGTSGVLSTLKEARGTIAYADEGEIPKKLGRTKLKVKDSYVGVSEEAAARTIEVSKLKEGRAHNDVVIDINRTPDDTKAYPLVLVSYHVVCSAYKDEKTAEFVKDFENYVISDEGQKESSHVARNAPLPKNIADKAKKAVESINSNQGKG